MISRKELKEALTYNPDTGDMSWRISPAKNVKKGDVAGCCAKGYIQIRLNKKHYQAHRLAWLYMTGKHPKNEIDHINHIKADNRWENLREVTNRENSKNNSRSKINTSGVTGVKWCKRDKVWESVISSNHKKIYLGRFSDFDEAVKIRKKAEIMYGFHKNHGKTKQEIQAFMDNAPEVKND